MSRLDADAPESNVAGEFTGWVPWTDRLTIPDGLGGHIHDYGGVYLLVHFPGKAPSGPANFLNDTIVYVGEGANLKRRWYSFERSALLGLPGHSGGLSYHRRYATRWKTLHVAALPIRFESEGITDASMSLARRFRLHVEQLLLWKLAVHRRGQQLMLLNAK